MQLELKKSNDWKAEKERRMFYTSDNVNLSAQNHSSVIQRPSAVYLGRKIKKLNQKMIVDTAKEKGIPVYKMGFNDDSQTYRLKWSQVE